MPYLKRPDVELFYEVHGDGPPFLFISETACHGEIWKEHQVPPLAKDHTVITYDQRGTGRSGPFEDEITTRMLAEDAVAILDAVGKDPAIVFGHSMGGRVAQLVALDFPDRVSRLILASSGAAHKHAPGIPLSGCIEMVEKGYERYYREHLIDMAFTPEFQREHADEVEAYLKLRLTPVVPLKTYLRYMIARQGHDTEHRLKEITVPTLVIVGEREDNRITDVTHVEAAAVLAKGIPGARLVVLPDQKHCYHHTLPDGLNKAIRDFIDEGRRQRQVAAQ